MVRVRHQKQVAELGYRANNVARSLTSKTSRIIGLLIPDSANIFFSEVAKGVEDTAYACGYRVILCNTHQDNNRLAEYIDALISQMVDGVIMITTPLSEQIALLEQYEVPVVLVDPEKKKNEVISPLVGLVSMDSYEGGRLAANHLLDSGYSKISIITDMEDVSPSAERVEGFQDLLNEAGIKPKLTIARGDKILDGYKAAEELLNSSQPPEAIFACNDMMAIGVVRCANDRKVRIPDELAVIGYDDIELANYITPRLTTIRQPKYQMGEIAAKLLLKKINAYKTNPKYDSDDQFPHTITMNVELVIRETTKRSI
jgi:LacI family transcriptional regulator